MRVGAEYGRPERIAGLHDPGRGDEVGNDLAGCAPVQIGGVEVVRRVDHYPPIQLESLDGRPAFAQLEHLADQLPPTERAAVVLRYGYDLDYSDIGAALGSNATAARQAASAGIRRLRQKELR